MGTVIALDFKSKTRLSQASPVNTYMQNLDLEATAYAKQKVSEIISEQSSSNKHQRIFKKLITANSIISIILLAASLMVFGPGPEGILSESGRIVIGSLLVYTVVSYFINSILESRK